MATKKAAPKKLGRPTDYTPKLALVICSKLAEGESLVSVCKADTMPHRSTVFRWLADRADFRDTYARAREAQADKLAEEVVEIADRVLPAIKKTVKGKGKSQSTEEVHGDAVERSRLMMDARKWFAAKLAPKKYGEKVQVGGAEDLPPISGSVVHELSEKALLAIAAGARAK